jgi:hypothetical protein
VPDITPVDVLKFNPVNILGEIEYNNGVVPPVAVIAENGVTAWSIIKTERETSCAAVSVDRAGIF